MDMSQPTLPLMITNVGYNAYTSIVSQGHKIQFTVAVGDAGSGPYTPPTAQTQQLVDPKDQKIPVSSLIKASDQSSTFSITATIPANSAGGTYSINEIGLFVQDSSQSGSSPTLFAIYGNATSLAQKTSNVVLGLNFTIDMQGLSQEAIETGDYEPQFDLSLATQQTAGLVQLASLSNAQSQVAGCALTTDLFGQGPFIPMSCGTNTWSTATSLALNDELPASFKNTSLQPIGGYYDQADTITLLCAQTQPETNILILVTSYSIEKATFTLQTCATVSNDGSTTLFRAENISAQDPANGTWVVLGTQVIWQIVLKGGKIDSSSRSLTGGSSFDFGNLIYYNDNHLYLFGGHTNSSTQIGVCDASTGTVNTSLGNMNYSRLSPLLQVVGNKIYCFGGNDTSKDGYSSNVELQGIGSGTIAYQLGNFRLFSLSLTNVTTSALSGNYAYLFQPQTYYDTAKDPSDHNVYRFDLYTNIFETLSISNNAVLHGGSTITPRGGIAVACGDGRIALFNSYDDSANGSTISASIFTPFT